MTRVYTWANPIRTGDSGAPGGRIYDVDPAAVARLKELIAASQPKPEPKPDPVLNLLRATTAKQEAMKKITLPPEEVAALYTRYQDGATLEQLAAEVSLNRQTLIKQFHDNGHPYPLDQRRGRKPRREVTDADLRDAYAAYQRGASTELVAENMGIAETTLGRWWRERGLAFPLQRDRLNGGVLVDENAPTLALMRPVEIRDMQPVSGQASPHPLVGQIINQLLDWRDALKAHGVQLEGTLFVGGPVSVTIDL